MTAPMQAPASEVSAPMDDTPQSSTSGPSNGPRPARTPTATTNTAMLMAFAVALIGVVGAVLGLPVYYIDGEVDDLEARVVAHEDKMDVRFAEQGRQVRRQVRGARGQDGRQVRGAGRQVDARFVALEDKMDVRFAEQDAKFDARFVALEDKMDVRFAEQDAKFDARFVALEDKMDVRFAELQKGQVEINRTLTALVASLNKTEAVDAALESRIE